MNMTDAVHATEEEKEKEKEGFDALDEQGDYNTPPLEIHLISRNNKNSNTNHAVNPRQTTPSQPFLELDEEKSTASSTECSTTIPHASCSNNHGWKPFFVFAFVLLLAYFTFPFLFRPNGLMEGSAESADVAALRERFMAAFPHLKSTAHSLFPLLNATILHDLLVSSAEGQTARQHIGKRLYEQGARVSHPVVMVPGFVTSGLEVWAAKDCMKRFFRQRVWTAITGATSFLGERECWKEHMMLDPWTGSDPDGIRVRAAEGFVAADFFVMNYWVWGKLIENLAEVGYSPSNMVMQPYDWRLPFPLLEERDGYFTNLKAKIESLHKITGKKIVLSTHSMGALVIHHFFGWVTSPAVGGGGGGGDKWVNEHVEAYINIAGSHLGVPKAATALLSGEMSDTVFGGRMASLVEHIFGRRPRRDLWSSWGSLWAMLPKGSDRLWGPGADFCQNRLEDDPLCPPGEAGISPMISITDEIPKQGFAIEENVHGQEPLLRSFIQKESHTTSDLLDFLQEYGGGLGPDTAGAKFHSPADTPDIDRKRHWYDPSRHPLPRAPNMKIFCLYGVGLPTERAYHYKRNWNYDDVPSKNGPRNISEPSIIIDAAYKSSRTNTTFGIRYSDGDGSVPLLSLGYICADAWQRPETGLNPSRTAVYTREYTHKAEFRVDDPMRGGPASCDHVDILGNAAMIEDFIKVATGFEVGTVEDDRIVSKLRDIAAAINAHPGGGLGHQTNGRWPWKR